MKNRAKLTVIGAALAVAALALPASANAAAHSSHTATSKSSYQEPRYSVHMDTKCAKMEGLV
jgi:hypothetical protein